MSVDDSIIRACDEALRDLVPVVERVVTKFAVVIEYADAEGGRGLARISGPIGTTKWEARGLWFDALYGDWGDE